MEKSTIATSRMHGVRPENWALPIGAVTFLFTDIEGSTALWERDGARMAQALAAHDTLARSAVEERRGAVVKMTGDGIHAAFDDPHDALAAALALQQALTDPVATCGVALRVRCGLHAGVVERRDNDYFGSPVNRAARIMSAAHGGQVLLSQAVVDGVRALLPASVSLRDLGNIRLKDLASPEHVYQVVHPDLRLDFPALRSLAATPNNLPQQATSFVGREDVLPDLRRLLGGTRLLTLTGSGGCGKSRLMLQVAADTLEQFPDGAWLMELAPLADPYLLPQAVATVLGLKEAPSIPIVQTLIEHLKDKRLLLLLDNCEHLLAASAMLADALLRRCPDLKILTSSREALGIAGEQAYRVPSLRLPDPKQTHTATSVAQFEAVRLFIERARLARADFKVTDQNAPTLASVCYRLDGIPLAIELAAARMRTLAVEELNGRLHQRFSVLTGGPRTALPRQQTLRSLIDWSFDLLGDAEKFTLLRLSVFVGGWTLGAAEKVCTGEGVESFEVLDLLTSLSDKSLVVPEPTDDRSRFRLLETVRQYARDRLVEKGGGHEVRERHRDYFLALAKEAEGKLQGVEQAQWLRRLEEEHENLRAGLNWCLAEQDCAGGLRLCRALHRFWWARGYLSEGREWCAQMLAKDSAQEKTQARANALNVAGVLAYHQSDHRAALALHEESLVIRRQLDDRKGVAASLNNLGLVACDQGEFATANALYQESLAIKRDLGDQPGIANSLNNLGNVAYDQGDLPAARALYGESLTIARKLEDREGIARLLGNLGNVARHQRDFTAARALNEESLARKRELGYRQRIAGSLNSLGNLASDQGDFASARAHYHEALTIGRELGDKLGIATSLEGLATVFDCGGNSLRAARIWGAAQRLRTEAGTPLTPKDRPYYDRQVAKARAASRDGPAFDQSWQEGHAGTLEQAIKLALGQMDGQG